LLLAVVVVLEEGLQQLVLEVLVDVLLDLQEQVPHIKQLVVLVVRKVLVVLVVHHGLVEVLGGQMEL